jgi:hypothetical protein
MRSSAISASRFQPKAHLAVLALVSFILSFIVARSFTYLYPDVVLVGGGLHIHHFWFGLILLAVGGWLGISYTQKEIDMLAAIIYGVGGGLIADELGLLLTLGNYYSGLTWTFMLLLLSFISVLILINRYRQSIYEELHEFVSSKASLPLGVFLVAVSAAFVVQTDNSVVPLISASLTVAGILIVLAFLIHEIRQKTPKYTNPETRLPEA